MQIQYAPMGELQTNCYIVTNNGEQIVIDPGQNAQEWLSKNLTNPKYILNTHGHFDHVWSNQWLKQKYDLPIYCPKDDVFMLREDLFSYGLTPSEPDVEVKPDEEFEMIGLKVKFWHFPGHTPGCSAIEIGDSLFSGDFIFYKSIGRSDFPYSNQEDMKRSIQRVLTFKKDFKIYPGHGQSTTLSDEKKVLPTWLRFLD